MEMENKPGENTEEILEQTEEILELAQEEPNEKIIKKVQKQIDKINEKLKV